ncbi:hypothetical protein LOD99_11709 [Oopsacas minuta]|uniref:Uncharacterized protein n=1 Tax=Oopsacas minuta TaxID=111878 RepID=A0AAV7JKW9_9METZ|nr:hypothetical protein LOD99_11709 [Oopsacas minuta]
MKIIIFVLSVCSLISIENCELFTWNFDGQYDKIWEEPHNWLINNSTAIKSPCRKDNVSFPEINSTLTGVITVSTNVEVLGINWKGENVFDIEEIRNLTSYFNLQNGGSITIDPDCGGRSVCSCTAQAHIGLIIGIICILIIIPTGVIIVSSIIVLILLIRKLYKSKIRKSEQEFTFQTLRELDVEDDNFDTTAISQEEFPSGKENIPEDLTGLIDEDSVNGSTQELRDKIFKSKKIPEDKKALLADSSQDLIAMEDVEKVGSSNKPGPGNQTDL